MRRKAVVFMLLAAVMALTACGKDPVDIQKEYVSLMETPVSEQQIEKVETYLEENLSDMKEEAADEMLIEYEAYIYPYYNGNVDYDRIRTLYGKYASSHYEDLCGMKEKEQQNPATKAGKLAISRAELCARANELEILIGKDPEKKAIRQDADALYKNYVKLLLAGAADSPNFDLKTGAFLKEAETAYRTFLKENPDTVLAGILGEYLDYVQQMGGKLDLSDAEAGKEYYNTCTYLEAEAGKRVME
ncbi:hypothetical protein NE619_01830 [Anaerovorax odorimutans]|uniref:DUF3829 domain-containing protein n=1 Tax=Anaerovorax odorimutans TaxID=109327 RepID=A0ABT1RKG6_9FIRM|nr:hypothetical protein [Anaerovorax odorimutans]MCQ4635456.1 hypothetical protein [Anaerovorax odorimutans]